MASELQSNQFNSATDVAQNQPQLAQQLRDSFNFTWKNLLGKDTTTPAAVQASKPYPINVTDYAAPIVPQIVSTQQPQIVTPSFEQQATPQQAKPRPKPAMIPKATDVNPQQQALNNLEQRIQERNDSVERPKPPNSDPIKSFMSLGAVIGAMGSLLTRQPLTAGFNALAAAAEANKQNDMETYKLKMQEWEDYTKFAVENQRNETERLKMALQEKHANRQDELKAMELHLRSQGIAAANQRAIITNLRWQLNYDKAQHSFDQHRVDMLEKNALDLINRKISPDKRQTAQIALAQYMQERGPNADFMGVYSVLNKFNPSAFNMTEQELRQQGAINDANYLGQLLPSLKNTKDITAQTLPSGRVIPQDALQYMAKNPDTTRDQVPARYQPWYDVLNPKSAIGTSVGEPESTTPSLLPQFQSILDALKEQKINQEEAENQWKALGGEL